MPEGLVPGALRRSTCPEPRPPPPAPGRCPADLESEVRQLQRDLSAAHTDDAEVQQLVAAHEREKAAAARLRSELEGAQVGARAGAGMREGGAAPGPGWRATPHVPRPRAHADMPFLSSPRPVCPHAG
jgi:hypothetical protein